MNTNYHQVKVYRVNGRYHVSAIHKADGTIETYKPPRGKDQLQTGVLLEDVANILAGEGYYPRQEPGDRPGQQTVIFEQRQPTTADKIALKKAGKDIDEAGAQDDTSAPPTYTPKVKFRL